MTSTPAKKIPAPAPSKSALKRWVWVPLALILALGLALAQIDLNAIKEQLVQRVSSEMGLQIEMDSIGFSFSHGLGFKCEKVEVRSPDGNRFSVDRLHLLAEWGPLLQGELKIKSIALEHPEATLTLPEPSAGPAPVSGEKQEEKLPAQTELIDPAALKSATGQLKKTQLSIEELIISGGKITLIRAGSQKQIPFDIEGTFVLNRSAGNRQDILAKALKMQTGSIIFAGDGSVANITTERAAVSFNLTSNNFSWAEVQPALAFLGDPASQTFAPIESVDVNQLSIKAGFPLTALSQIETLQEKMTGQVELKTSNTVLKFADKNYNIESMQGEGTWEKGFLMHKFSGTALGSDFSLNGTVPLFNRDKDTTSQIEWKNLDLEKLPFLNGLAWSPTQGKVSGTVSLTGPIPAEGEVFPGRLRGSVEFQSEHLTLKSASVTRLIEVRKLTGHGDFNQGILNHEIHGTIWGSDFDIKGKLPLNQKIPLLDSQINWTALDVAQLPLPATTGWQPTAGTLSGALTVQGPMPVAGENFPGSLKGSLNFVAQNLKLQNEKSAPLFFKQLEGTGDIKNHRVSYDLKGNAFNGTFHSDGIIRLAKTGASLAVLDNKVTFTHLDLSQLPLSATEKTGTVSGTLKLKGPLPDPKNILTGNLKIDSTFKVTGLKMQVDTLPLNIQQLEGKGSLKQGQLTHDLNGTVFGGKFSTKGLLTFKQNNDQTLVSANSDLMLDKVGLNWVPLIYKSEWAPASGTVTGKLKINGPLPAAGKISPALKLKGHLNGEKLVLKNGAITKAQLDFKESSSTSSQMQVALENIRLGERNFKKVTGLLQISPEKIDLARGQIWPLNGSIKLIGNLKPESGNYRLKFKGEQLKVEEFLPAHLKGPLEFSGTITGNLPQNNDTPKLPDYAKDLSGDVKLNLVNGTLPELGVLKNLLILINPISALEAGKTGLSFDKLAGDFKIIKGVVSSDNLEMKSTQINLTAEGQANLVDDSIQAQVKAMPLQMLDKTLKAIPLLGQILTGGKKGGLIETYFKVHGKLSQPKFTLQPHKSLTHKPGSILNELMNLQRQFKR